MKKIMLYVLAMCMLLLCAFIYEPQERRCPESEASDAVQEESLREKLIREIDGAYEEESRDPENFTTGGMVDLAMKYRKNGRIQPKSIMQG